MVAFTIKGKPFSTNGDLPQTGKKAPDFKLTDIRLKDRSLSDFKGKKKIIYTVTSLDTDICEQTAREFSNLFGESDAGQNGSAVLLIVSGDLPFAQSRFINEQKIANITPLSGMRNRNFAKDYGLLIQDGPLAGLLARAVIVLDEEDTVIYSEWVSEITESPDYASAIESLT